MATRLTFFLLSMDVLASLTISVILIVCISFFPPFRRLPTLLSLSTSAAAGYCALCSYWSIKSHTGWQIQSPFHHQWRISPHNGVVQQRPIPVI